jgi:tetratricopeptide (TPR) repeat protein
MHEYEEAEAQWFAALQEAELFERTDRRLHITLEDLAELYFRQGKHVHAIVAANLAAMYFADRQLEDAEIFYRRALAIKTITSPKSDPDLVMLRVQYAQLLRDLGRHKEAEALTQNAMKQRQHQFRRSGVYEAYVQENPQEQAPRLEDRLLNAVLKVDSGKG